MASEETRNRSRVAELVSRSLRQREAGRFEDRFDLARGSGLEIKGTVGPDREDEGVGY